MKILVVDDDHLIATLVADTLTTDGHLVDAAHSAAEAKAYANLGSYDLMVLDWQLPDFTGIQLCEELRAEGISVPIIFLTSRAALEDKRTGYQSGADDYLTKPFEPEELKLKVRAILRRPRNIEATQLRVRDLVMNLDTRQLFKNSVEVHLLPKEYALLEFFMRHPNKVFSSDALLQRVWSTDSTAAPDTVKVTIMRIRQKLELDSEEPLITTIRGFGYRLDA
ncbi:MAG TPA: response regulator transcription factor [Drouetiella sp.]